MKSDSSIAKDWWQDAEEEVSIDLNTRAALERSIDARSAQARLRLLEERKKKAAVKRDLNQILEKMHPVSYWADLLGYEPNTIREWCKSEELESRWIKGQYRITQRAMNEFLNKQERRRG